MGDDKDSQILRLTEELAELQMLHDGLLDHSDAIEEQLGEQNATLERLSTQLSHYLSPQIYDAIFTGRSVAEISASRKKLTVFFCDIVNFTSITESMEPEELSGMLNNYLSELTIIALAHGATVDKYIGDCIMAFFGDPESQGDKQDAQACVRMAIAMQKRMGELAEIWAAKGVDEPFRLRIGINTGYCTVGNFGSSTRMDYTAIGTQVNIAARLQGKADIGGILVSHATYALVRDVFSLVEREALQLKGIAGSVRAYAVLDAGVGVDGQIMIEHGEGFRVEAELGRLSPESRERLAVIARDLLARVAQES
jgi:adenylate cyclase